MKLNALLSAAMVLVGLNVNLFSEEIHTVGNVLESQKAVAASVAGQQDQLADHAAVEAVLQAYIALAQTGRAVGLRDRWLNEARITGSVDGTVASLTPEQLIGWGEGNGASPQLQVAISGIEIAGTAASARVEFANWAGFRFTDFFVLFKDTGGWKIVGKVYDTHERNAAAGQAVAETEGGSYAHDAAALALGQAYIEGFRTGDIAAIRGLWRQDARVVGWHGGGLVNRDVEHFLKLIAEVKGQPDFDARVVSVDRSGPAARARIEIKDWKGVRYTDFLLFYNEGGTWKIAEKVFEAYTHR